MTEGESRERRYPALLLLQYKRIQQRRFSRLCGLGQSLTESRRMQESRLAPLATGRIVIGTDMCRVKAKRDKDDPIP